MAESCKERVFISAKNIILFKLKYKTGPEKLKLFGKYFVDKNKLFCKMIYKNKIYEIKEYLDDIDNNYKTEDTISIKLRFISFKNNYINARGMFHKCNSLLSISDIIVNKSNIFYLKNIEGLFYECNSLISLPDMSKLDTSKVINMSYMFYGCNSLSSLPDISKWNTSNVNDMSDIFNHCNSLSSLPDIGKWDTSNVTNMS